MKGQLGKTAPYKPSYLVKFTDEVVIFANQSASKVKQYLEKTHGYSLGHHGITALPLSKRSQFNIRTITCISERERRSYTQAHINQIKEIK